MLCWGRVSRHRFTFRGGVSPLPLQQQIHPVLLDAKPRKGLDPHGAMQEERERSALSSSTSPSPGQPATSPGKARPGVQPPPPTIAEGNRALGGEVAPRPQCSLCKGGGLLPQHSPSFRALWLRIRRVGQAFSSAGPHAAAAPATLAGGG